MIALCTLVGCVSGCQLPYRYAAVARDEAHPPVNVVFDTDMWSDIDDMMALAMLHALQDRHELTLKSVTLTTEDPWSASYVDLVDTFYGHPDIPIGMVHGGITAEATRQVVDGGKSTPSLQQVPYVQALSELRTPSGASLFPHRLSHDANIPEAVSLLRRTLQGQKDNSVVIIQVGFSTNLAHLLESQGDSISPLTGLALVKRKVRLLSIMAGSFMDVAHEGGTSIHGSPEFNLTMDVPSAHELFERWPSPIVVSGYEIGRSMLFPAQSVDDDFSYVTDHPVAESYRYFSRQYGWPHDHPTFDLTAVLYAARPDRGYFGTSRPGRITVLPDGSCRFEEVPGGRQRYLILNDNQRPRALEAMVMLVTQPPAGRNWRIAKNHAIVEPEIQ